MILDGVRVPFAGILEASAATAARLERDGVAPGARVVAALEGSREHLELVAACWRLGVELVEVAPTASAQTFAGILESTAPQAVFVDPNNRRLAGVSEKYRPSNSRHSSSPRPDSFSSDWREWLRRCPPAVFYTSGSTSTAKGVPLVWAKILEKAVAVLGHYGVSAEDRVMPILPLSHVYGLYWAMGAAALGAECIVTRESASPAALAAGLADHGATVVACPPLVGAFLFGRRGCESAVRERLRVLTMGGAATSREQAGRILAALPRTRVFLSYGLAETYSTVCCNEISLPGADLASVGRLRFGAFGEVRGGELCVGGTIMTGYVGTSDDVRKAAFTEDGLFRTGDLVRMDASGAISITGRLKEMINAGGLSIYPAEIEEALKQHPGVADCGVYGERSGELEIVCAAVVLRPACGGVQEIYDHARRHLSAKMVPRRIVPVAAIPRGALGKIARAELRALAQQEAQAEAADAGAAHR
jgi:acyl-CoA synthetase (AMP-forming)/AMP-acid ligase II